MGVCARAMLEGMQAFLTELDTEHETALQARETELTRIDEQETSWEAEKTVRSTEMKKDFMATRLKGVLPDDRKQVTELAEHEWSNLKHAYGF